MKEKRTKLSPIPYLKNNKARTSVLVISLALFIFMTYVLGYLLGAITEPFNMVILGRFDRMTLATDEIDVGDYETAEEWDALIKPLMEQQRDGYREVLSNDNVFVVKLGFIKIRSIMGEASTMLFLFENTNDMEAYADFFDAKLVSGRMPQKAGEIVVDRLCLANNGDGINDGLGDSYTIVGEVDTSSYMAFGFPVDAENNYYEMILHEEGEDVVSKLQAAGYSVDYYQNLSFRQNLYDNELGSLDGIKTLVSSVAAVLLGICLTVILSLHIRDRHEEWCLMNSIGFSVGEIYSMALRELLICFGGAFILGIAASLLGVFLLKIFMIDPQGLVVRVIRPEDMLFAAVLLCGLTGICQIPIFIQMRTITTVDEIE
ncbi:MAG: ABC transporter permease [Clostridiales bacterium]|nr:ABC transporter permease [Clostridiales bacterium]